MTRPLTEAEFRDMEILLGQLVEHCDLGQQRLVLRLHRQLTAIFEAQSLEMKQISRLRSLHIPGGNPVSSRAISL